MCSIGRAFILYIPLKMGLLDFLKGIIPEKLINLSIDNRKIEINNSSLVIGEQRITDPEIIDKVFDKISEYKDCDHLPFQIVHKELVNDYDDYEELSIVQKESIKKLKLMLPDEDVRCILMARRVKKLFDDGDRELATHLHTQLENHFPSKGSKVFNLVSGGYFDEMIIPFIEIFKSEYEEKYVEKYRDFYFNLLKFFPLAFFVSNNTTSERLRDGLIERLKLKDVPFVRLHAIGKNNIRKVEEIIDELGIEERFVTKDNRFTSPTGIKAQILEIKSKKSIS